jgi:hypothetical protein
MIYDLVAIGGSGAQFAQAILATAGWGLVDLPRRLIVVDADQRYFTGSGELAQGIRGLWQEANNARKSVATLSEGASAEADQPQEPIFLPPYSGPVHAESFDAATLTGFRKDHPLLQAIVTGEEIGHNIKDGLFGMAKIGGLLTSAAHSATDGGTATYPSSLIKLVEGSHLLVIAGSVAGGTGAGFMVPTLKAAVEKNPLRNIHVYAFLPWFQLPNSSTSDGRVNPSNERMALNASQGIRYLDSTVRQLAVGQEQMPRVKAVLFGLPPGAKQPERSNDSDPGAPGPLQYYAASLISSGAIDDQVVSQRPGPVFAVAVDGNLGGGESAVQLDQYPFAKHAQFKIADRQLPLGMLKVWLNAQMTALEYLGQDHLYDEAFPRWLPDNPDYLPRSLFDAIAAARPGVGEGGERRRIGVQFAEAARDRAQRVRKQLEVLGRAQVDDNDVLEAVASRPESWAEANLSNPLGLDAVLARGLLSLQPNNTPAATLSKSLTTPGVGREAARATFVAAMRNGLVADLKNLPHPKAGVAALPVAVQGQSGSPLVELDRRLIDQLVTYYARRGTPDSRSLPTPLAKASVAEHHVASPPLTIDPACWWTNPEERLKSVWLGIACGDFAPAHRYHVKFSGQTDALVRTIGHAERDDAEFPLRGPWTTVLVDRTHGVPVAASSPRLGWFETVRLTEERANRVPPGDDKVRDAYEKARATCGQLELAQAFSGACWLMLQALDTKIVGLAPGDDPVGRFPWYKLLRQWSADADPTAAARLVDPTNRTGLRAWFSVGPIPLHIGWQQTDQGRQPQYVDVWLPRLLRADVLEQHALAGAAAALFGGPTLELLQRDGGWAQVKVANGGPRVLELASFQPARLGLDADDQIRAGALAPGTGPGSKWPPQFPDWSAFLPTLRQQCTQFSVNRSQLPSALLSSLLGRPDAPAAFVGAGTEPAAWQSVVNLPWQRWLAPEGDRPSPLVHGWVNLYRSVPL